MQVESSMVASLVESSMAAAQTHAAVGTKVLSTALDAVSQQQLALLDTLPPASAPNAGATVSVTA